jgi:choline dehydrogenase-like flavoprotein
VHQYDVVIVGSGAAGGWAAKKLGEAGLDVLVLEAGPLFPDSRRPMILAAPPGRQPVQSKIYACNEHAHQYFVDDVDNPYTTPADKPFTWLRCRVLGGKMTMWAGLSLRMSPLDFKAASADGYGEDWPIAYEDLVPFYDEVDVSLEVTGEDDGIAVVPNGPSRRALPLDPVSRFLRERVQTRWKDRRVISGRYALASFDRVLSEAMQTGKVTVRPDTIVSHVVTDPATGLADRVAFVDRRTHATGEVRGKAILLCASPIESARILLNSKSSEHPNGLGNSSGTLGEYLMDHTFRVGIFGEMSIAALGGAAALRAAGQVSPSYIPRFTNLETREPDFLRGYGIQVRPVEDTMTDDSISLRILASGEMLSRRENRVVISPDQKDAWGIPAPHIECAYSENERAMVRHQLAFLRELADVGGMKIVREMPEPTAPGNSTHELGGARMGADRRTSVLDPFNRSWDVPNLLVTDGACFVSVANQNPTLTVMAITGRACARLASDFARGEVGRR